MSILETFYILFEADAKSVKKGAQEAEKATDSLEKRIKNADLAASQLGKSFHSLIGVATRALAGILSVGAVASGIAHAFANASEISKSANALKVELDTLQAWSEAARRAGGSGTVFRQSLTELNEKLHEFAKTGKGEIGPLLQQLGVHFRNVNGTLKTTPQLLLDIAKSFEPLSKIESTELGKKIGLDEATIALLQKGQRAIEDQIKQHKALGVLNKDDAQITKQYTAQLEKTKIALDDLGQVFRYLSTTMATSAMPALTQILKELQVFTTYLAQHRDLIKGFFIGLAAVLTTMYLPAVLTAASATLALLAPYLLIVDVIAALGVAFALVYEDVMNFLDGNNSVIGELAKRWPIVGDAVRALANIFSFLFDLVKAELTFIADLVSHPTQAFKRFAATVQSAFDKLLNKIPALKSGMNMLSSVFNQVGATVKAAWNGIAAAIDTVINLASKGLQIIGKVVDKIKAFSGISTVAPVQSNGFPGNNVASINQAALNAGKHALALTSIPLSAQTSNSITHANRSVNKNTSVQTGPITIHTQASDSAAIKRELSQGLEKELSTTLHHFDDGVAA